MSLSLHFSIYTLRRLTEAEAVILQAAIIIPFGRRVALFKTL